MRRSRFLVAVLALGVGIGTIAGPSPAAAHHGSMIIPPDGWCYNSWYNHGSDLGSSIQRYGPIKTFHNQTSQTVQWGESLQVQNTFSTTYQSTTFFQGGFDFGIVKATTQTQLQITIVNSRTVTETTMFTAPVPPHTTMNAEYGAWQRNTTGTYFQEEYSCVEFAHSNVTSGPVTGKSLTGEVGWRLWQS